MNSALRYRPDDRLSWLAILAMLLALVAAMPPHRFVLDLPRVVLPLAGLGLLAALMVVGQRTGRWRLASAATAFLQMTLFTILGVVLSYALAARAGPLWDPWLAAADRSLGIEWQLLLAALDRLPPVVWLLGIAYHSLIAQMVLVIVLLAQARRVATLRIMVAAAILSGFVTILVSGAAPAMGNVFDPDAYRTLWPSVAWSDAALIDGLRDGSHRAIDLGAMTGIVTFPSFHATLSLIFIWAFRRLPRFALAGGCWATLTIVATPVFGGHYAVDVVAGLLLAPPAIAAAHWLSGRSLNAKAYDLLRKSTRIVVGRPRRQAPEAGYDVA
jgi:membrane-associated phospholipid phosphatase